MILKIFTKRKKGGHLVDNSLTWKNEFIEADVIRMTPFMGRGVKGESKADGFDFVCITEGKEPHDGACGTDVQGYEIIDKHGNVIERYVTSNPED